MADNNDRIQIKISDLKTKMGEIEGYFEELDETLKDANSFWNDHVNVLDEAIFGTYGGKILALWEANAATFSDFHDNFDNWSALVSTAIAKNIDLEADIIDIYRTSGISMDGVDEARQSLKNGGTSEADLSDDAKDVLNRGKVDVAPDANEYGGKTLTYTNKDGKTVALYFDKDGKLVCKHEYKAADNGNDTSEDKYYDANGKEIDKKPDPKEYESQKQSSKETEETEETSSTEETEETEETSSTEETEETSSTEETEETSSTDSVVDDPTVEVKAKLRPGDSSPEATIVPNLYNTGGQALTWKNSDGDTVIQYNDSMGNSVGWSVAPEGEKAEFYNTNFEQVASGFDLKPSPTVPSPLLDK